MKKYEITKEQILELENGFTLPKLKQWFPEAFKNELKVGKWYKENKENNFMFCFQGIYSRYESSKAYGFTLSGKWYENLGVDKESTYFEATEQEVKTALENEAVKRGFKKGVTFKSLDNKHCTLEGTSFLFKKNTLYATDGFKDIIFKNGVWATIIKPKQLTKE